MAVSVRSVPIELILEEELERSTMVGLGLGPSEGWSRWTCQRPFLFFLFFIYSLRLLLHRM